MNNSSSERVAFVGVSGNSSSLFAVVANRAFFLGVLFIASWSGAIRKMFPNDSFRPSSDDPSLCLFLDLATRYAGLCLRSSSESGKSSFLYDNCTFEALETFANELISLMNANLVLGPSKIFLLFNIEVIARRIVSLINCELLLRKVRLIDG